VFSVGADHSEFATAIDYPFGIFTK
jgi:hypothetical protein